MKKYYIALFVIGIIIISYLLYSIFHFERNDWDLKVPGAGSTSSPRAVDLNGDGILDIVIGAGAREFMPTQNALLAIDGKDGSILWKLAARNQFIGSPMFMDLNADGTEDIFIGGRSSMLIAVDGKSGEIIWEYLKDNADIDYSNDTTILNFYNPVFVPDVTGDNIKDIVITYGGFIKALPTETNRPSVSLMIINSATGEKIAKEPMPDRKETYMSPVVYDFNNDGELEIIYGSGGETINGHLYRTTLADLLNGDLSNSIMLDSGRGKGYIAPPLIADVNGDNVKDIIVNSVKGRVVCIDGKTNEMLWENHLGDEFEIYTMPAPGYFNGGDELFIFTSLGHGVWPEIDYAKHVVLRALDGELVYQDSSGTFQYASPVVYDFNKDGKEDVLFAINKFAIPNNVIGNRKMYQNELTIFDIANQKKFYLQPTNLGTNLGSTPLITDLDQDGKIDVVYCFMSDAYDYYSFKNMEIQRREFNIRYDIDKLKWGSYMGTNYNGIY